ncbi:MAG: hypothetical protein RLZZ200_545 [Pseudomonadota bacterium]
MTVTPGLCTLILAANGLIGLASLTFARSLPGALMFWPWEFARGRRTWTAVTATVVHADFPHLLFNLVTLWSFGPILENRLGSLHFGLLYGLGVLVSQGWTFLRHREDPRYATLGDSGAISAVLFAAIVYRPLDRLILFPIPVPIPAALFAVGYLAWSWWSERSSVGRINHGAHLGGALAGLGYVLLVDPGAVRQAARLLGVD